MSKLSSTGRAGARSWLGRLMAGGVATAVLLTFWAPGAMAAPRPLTVDVLMGDSCVSGTARKNAFVKVVVRDPAGNMKLREAVDTGPYGEWGVCGYSGTITAGDKINVLVVETGQTRKFKVPKLTIDANRVSEVVSGKAPAGSVLAITVSTAGASSVGLPEYEMTESVVTSAGGTYSFDFSTYGIDLIGGATAEATWKSAGGAVQVHRWTNVPGLMVAVGEAWFGGSYKPNAHLGITVTKGITQVATGDAIGDPYLGGQVSGQFVDADAEPYALAEGDWINAPGLGTDGIFQVPAIGGSANLSNERVSGTCFDNGLYLVAVLGRDYYEYGFTFGVADANGKFTADLADQLNIRKNFTVQIGCYTANADLVVGTFITH